MKKITSQKFSKRIAQYGALSVAIAGVADASGQIMYTDIADETIAPGGNYTVDINNDAIGDLLFIDNTAGNFAVVFPVSSYSAPYFNSNRIVGFNAGAYNYPSNLTTEIINSTNGVFQSARGDLNFNGCAYSGSQFCDGLDGYIGLHFNISGEPHYGWIRIQVASDASSIIIKDYAYNATQTVPGFGDPIMAGQTVLGIDDNEINKIKVVALNKSIGLYNLPQETSYKLFNMTGQKVLNGTTNNRDYVIEAQSLASGVYIVELADTNSDGVIRKKVVLQ